ncbi:MAG: hypothetical protein UW63_C0070G0003 [Candidatus Uhrbacteria bacterium GW2011_GWF2_44_350]|uniref:Uncharacterized protein n=1 Tax=Candidatus Uhrbacteria bacterium GW2011_GWF2_44_350 TaxID=1619000 RepID=A0A0G1JBJ1_9BACT|nr:MAG: hypothetical protein UW63_C0070G0003 [Candidatus Uhrbacteria bacterium GW2011_GWF2_44_350]HBR80849.1 hypothetical protein [Candidatus Uhrbacteria bacterium]HCU32155.1 hypothetical protein [Candidatus Uhrbacteria bacterium]
MKNQEGGGQSPGFDQVGETPSEFSWRTSRSSLKSPKAKPVLGSLENFGLEEIQKHQEKMGKKES